MNVIESKEIKKQLNPPMRTRAATVGVADLMKALKQEKKSQLERGKKNSQIILFTTIGKL